MDRDRVISRRGTVLEVEGENRMILLFGRWIKQLNRADIIAENIPKKLSQNEQSDRKDAKRRLRAVSKPIKEKKPVVVPEPKVYEKSYCKVTGKRIYSIGGAKRALSSTIGKRWEVPIRMYKCDHCQLYHLSSKN